VCAARGPVGLAHCLHARADALACATESDTGFGAAGLHGNSQLDMSKLMKMMPGTLPFPISSEGFHNMRETVLSEVDFWTEDENRNFCNAIGMAMDSNNKFAPDWDVVAARVGNKSKDQCQSYYKFYNVALQDSKKRAEREGKAAVKEIKAEEVFEFLGVRSDYLNFLRNRPTGELGKGAAAVLTGGSAGSGIGGGTSRSSKGSIDFLCGGGGADDRPTDKKDDPDALAHPSGTPFFCLKRLPCFACAVQANAWPGEEALGQESTRSLLGKRQREET